MSAVSADGVTELAPRPGRRRWRPVLAVVVAVLLAAGAFLLWGPIGLGSGPLRVGMGNAGGVDQNRAPVAFIVPIYNTGRDRAVVDAVAFVDGTRFPAPRILALGVVSDARCGGSWPARAEGRGFALVGCGGRYRGPLIGYAVPYAAGISPGFPAAAEAAAPWPGSCWVLSKVIVHYHIGIRHYTTSGPFELSVCSKSAASQVNAAMNASGAAAPQ
jgi:hypothetical protein